jgi:class III poly(R)-hydroxyalkanoic acid synthase PhaE subunit
MAGSYPGFDLFARMQELAARMAADGANANADAFAGEWKRALGATSPNPFASAFQAMGGDGMQGLDAWNAAMAPWLEAARREGGALLGLPAFGIGREHQERLQALAQAQLDYARREGEFNLLMLRALERAHALFGAKLTERSAPGKALDSARALFDLWIDAAEEAYAEVALSPEFRSAYGALVNAQMRLRQGVQREVEQAAAQVGMPTRTEIDAAHRRIAELERALRRMRDGADAAPGAAASRAAKATPAAKPPATAKKAAAAKSAPTRPTASKKPAAKTPTPKKPAPAARTKR